VFARGFGARRRRGWVVASIATLLGVFILESWPDLDSLGMRLLIGTAVMFGFVAAVAARLAQGLQNAAGTTGPVSVDVRSAGGAVT